MTPQSRGARALAGAAAMATLALAPVLSQPGAPDGASGLREPAWAPDGKRLAVVFLDRIWTMTPDGRDGRPLVAETAVQREPAWSPDGRRVAFSMDRGGGFDLFLVRSPEGRHPVERVTTAEGDERGAAWTPDGRLVFSHRPAGAAQWDLFVVAPEGDGGGWGAPARITATSDNELQPRVSPDGMRLAFASDRDSDEGDVDIWAMRMPAPGERVPERSTAERSTGGAVPRDAAREPAA